LEANRPQNLTVYSHGGLVQGSSKSEEAIQVGEWKQRKCNLCLICFTNSYGGKETITGIKIDVLHP